MHWEACESETEGGTMVRRSGAWGTGTVASLAFLCIFVEADDSYTPLGSIKSGVQAEALVAGLCLGHGVAMCLPGMIH